MRDKVMIQWLEIYGVLFLKEIGLKKDDHILDFGCRHGTYSIPAAKIIGDKGRVYAIDKEKSSLDELMKRSSGNNLFNITAIQGTEQVIHLLEKNNLDMILLYDVYHLIQDRTTFLSNLHTLLKPSGILSIYPRHHKEKMNMNIKQIISEIESIGFQFLTSHEKTMMHDDQLVKDTVYNFKAYNK